MKQWVCRLLCVAACFAGNLTCGQTIFWNSDANAINRTSSDLPMDGGFRFELGVFKGAFVPTAANMAEWAANWVAKIDTRVSYETGNARFAGKHIPQDNEGHFAINNPAYVWGFKGDAVSGEWILFRSASWLWPEVDPPAPPPANAYEWFVRNATPVLGVGTINASGSPFLMKSVAVSNVSPPPTYYSQWQTETLTGEPLNASGDDPDKDGVSNLLEFVFGTPPRTAGASTLTPVSLVGGKLQISIPRRIDHPALLTVEVSGDLTNWASGPAHTEVLGNDVSGLLVRDLTALDPAHPKRFMRLKAEPAVP